MKYSIELGKIIEGAFKYDQTKIINYTKQLISKLEADGEIRASKKFSKILDNHNKTTLTPMGANHSNDIPVDPESRSTLAEIIYPSDNNFDVILSKTNEERLQTFILSYKSADKLNSMGIGPSNTLLLFGPPGCGKTKSAYLIAKELDLPLVIARLDSLISSYLGTTAKNIRTLFDFAQKTPCVLFLDEFDAIAKARDDGNELGELKRVVNSLLQNVDSMSNDSLLLAATNHERLLDPAIWRRFDYKLEIGLPDHKAIIRMIELFTDGISSFTVKEKNELATAFQGLSGSDIEEIVKRAIRNTVIIDEAFSIKAVYNELFIFKNIIPQDYDNKRELIKIKAKYLRNCNEKTFSYSTLADIFGVSKTTIGRIFKEEVIK
ncbi:MULTISPECIES: ATP-binding protein [Clostridia]|uniref:AAA family ATPase n=1 Tax=Clostridia TaxID=186801 RepID=UPI000EA3D808|nr:MULTISPECIES: ATP-binding protein [Clostridia]NBJ71688.1 ATP-binding protein [Roseburia sp. 1XD42-34]RKI73822.1 ATP-binding protein [Clostridium sp. 1xD42-85]